MAIWAEEGEEEDEEEEGAFIYPLNGEPRIYRRFSKLPCTQWHISSNKTRK